MSGRQSLNYRSLSETAIILIQPPPLLSPSSTLSGSTLGSSLNFQYLFVNDAVPLLHLPPVFFSFVLPFHHHSVILTYKHLSQPHPPSSLNCLLTPLYLFFRTVPPSPHHFPLCVTICSILSSPPSHCSCCVFVFIYHRSCCVFQRARTL